MNNVAKRIVKAFCTSYLLLLGLCRALGLQSIGAYESITGCTKRKFVDMQRDMSYE